MSSLAIGLSTSAILWLCLPNRTARRVLPSTRSQNLGERWWSKVKARRRDSASHSLIFTEVASLLRIGLPPGVAWRRAAGVAVDELGVPNTEDLTTQVGARAACAMVAASRLALTLGAPLSNVLLNISNTLVADDEATSEREAAFAGPQTTARVLMALPLLGLVLGWFLGANPVAIMMGGGIGSASVALGVLALGLGRVWINRLMRQARLQAEAGT